MHTSLSLGVLKKLIQHQKLESTNPVQLDPIKYLDQICTKTFYSDTHKSPKQLSYNQIINNQQNWKRYHYRLRNYRQPKLKIIQPKNQPKSKIYNLTKLIHRVKQPNQQLAWKKRYDSALSKYCNEQIIKVCQSQHHYRKNTLKFPQKLHFRFRFQKRSKSTNESLQISGQKLRTKQSDSPVKTARQRKTMDYMQLPKNKTNKKQQSINPFQYKYQSLYKNMQLTFNQPQKYQGLSHRHTLRGQLFGRTGFN